MKNKHLSASGIKNLNWLTELLQHRLQSKGKSKSLNNKGEMVYVNCDVFARETLEAFMELSVSDFNQVPYFTNFSLDDNNFIETFAEVLIEGAVLHALASQALIERGREYQVIDNGVTLFPPNLSEMMNNQFSILLSFHWEKVKTIKSGFSEYNIDQFR